VLGQYGIGKAGYLTIHKVFGCQDRILVCLGAKASEYFMNGQVPYPFRTRTVLISVRASRGLLVGWLVGWLTMDEHF